MAMLAKGLPFARGRPANKASLDNTITIPNPSL
jgi:hypothetical protein